MSEYELIMMHKRLEVAKRQKAQRCELIQSVPCGYLKLPTGEAVLDPDEEARSIVQLVFDKFDELGSFGQAVPLSGAEQGPPGDASAARRTAGSIGVAPAHAVHAGPNTPSSDLRRSLLLRASPRGSQKIGFRWHQGQDTRDADVRMDGAPNGSTAGLHHVGPLLGQPRAAAAESLPARLSRCASCRQGAVWRVSWFAVTAAGGCTRPTEASRPHTMCACESILKDPIVGGWRRRPLMTW